MILLITSIQLHFSYDWKANYFIGVRELISHNNQFVGYIHGVPNKGKDFELTKLKFFLKSTRQSITIEFK